MTAVRVRDATVEDAAGISRVAERSWTRAYGEILARETIKAALAEWYDGEVTREAIERDDVAYLVADDGSVVGYASGGPRQETDVAELGALYVEPDRWGEGVGTALLEAFEAACRRWGREAVACRVLARNDVGTSFYRSRGYEALGERESDLFGETVRVRRFRRRLDR